MLKNIFLSLFLLSLIFITANAHGQSSGQASCLNSMTDNYLSDSTVFQLDSDHYDIKDYGNDHLAHAIRMIRILIEEKIGCRREDINFGKGPWGKSRSRCVKVQPNVHESLVCYIETNLGNFMVTWDAQTTVNFIFKRWD